jgi:hypothetical protein
LSAGYSCIIEAHASSTVLHCSTRPTADLAELKSVPRRSTASMAPRAVVFVFGTRGTAYLLNLVLNLLDATVDSSKTQIERKPNSDRRSINIHLISNIPTGYRKVSDMIVITAVVSSLKKPIVAFRKKMLKVKPRHAHVCVFPWTPPDDKKRLPGSHSTKFSMYSITVNFSRINLLTLFPLVFGGIIENQKSDFVMQ